MKPCAHIKGNHAIVQYGKFLNKAHQSNVSDQPCKCNHKGSAIIIASILSFQLLFVVK